jgi:hypothetical protein
VTAGGRWRDQNDGGEYAALCKYLRDRFADRVVLTFGQIEDILGFRLPGPASVEPGWWGGTDSADGQTTQSDAWTLAGRRASVHLSARRVTFERIAPACVGG